MTATEPSEPAPRPLTGGAVMAGTSRVIVALTGAGATILIARVLGPSGSGAYYVAQSLMLLLTVSVSVGLEHGIAYYVSSGAWAPRRAYSVALRMALAVGLLGAAIGLGARLLVPSAFASLSVAETAAVVAGLPFALTWFYVSFIGLSTDRYEAYVLPPAAQSALALAFVAPGALLFDLTGAVVGLALSNVIVGAGAAIWGRRSLPAAADAEERPMLRRAISFGVKGYAANALQLLNYRLDLFILSAVTSAASVGRYSVAVAVTQVLWLFPQGLADVLFPRVAQLSAREGEDADAQREMVEVKSLRHVTLAVVVGTVVLAAALVLLVVPVYGEAFRPSIDLGLILLPGVALIGISGVLSSTIVGRGKPIYSLYIALITTPLTIGLYAVLIPWLDAKGAALASSVSYAASFVLACFFYRRVTGRNPLPLLRPGRSELDDLRALPGAVAAWLRGLRR